ncbi:chemotaxis protein CheW [Tautonia sociabilis]|uniref:Chemotaxis protein n=1 Tax=Tautonia sociabilis TaxID=2080755 RepID=A0A432MJE1_9BACT|nr:chemotaxis protein CheW [Tautonia sociabilis]RUL87501.1 chemotaxis protein [Tautonia sociabilis]
MLILRFEAGGDRYGVPAADVEQVVPRVPLRGLPHAAEHLAGLLDYRGEAIPVVDLAVLLGGPPTPDRLSTRIAILSAREPGPGLPARVGLIAEQVRDLTRADAGGTVIDELPLQRVGYLGPFVRIDGRLVQLIRPDRLLAEAVATESASVPGASP